MLLNRTLHTTLLAISAVVVACDVPVVASSPTDVQGELTSDGPTELPDVSEGVDAPDASEDADVPQDDEIATPDQAFAIGVNETGKNTPDSFEELPEGGELLVELGAQGLWMVVLAFRTYGYFDAKVIIRATIEVGGESQGELALAKQKLAPGGDGWDYYYNFFLVVPDPALAGEEALIRMRVEDDLTEEIEVLVERQVTLVGGEL